MNELKLLIVEDDEELIKSYKRDVKSFNLTSGVKIKEVVINDKDKAIEILEDSNIYFDAAIVDLRLDKNGLADQIYSGNEVIRKIKNNLRFPVFVITGTPHLIDPDLTIQNSLFKIKTRGEDDNYLDQFIEIYNTGITKILSRKGIIEQYLNNIFWNHLSASLDIWINDKKRTPEEKQKSLLRYTLLHIQEYLEITNDSDFEDYHPAETYITPAIKDSLFTGDIVVENKTFQKYIILTPSCDMAQKKAKDFLLVTIENCDSGIVNEKRNLLKKGKADEDVLAEAENTIKALIDNSYSNKYHFLPAYKEIKAGLINFQKLKSVRSKDFGDNYNIVASTNSSFTKDIVARFSYYYSRQGSPDFNIDEIYQSLL